MDGDDEDDLWLVQALAVLLQASQEGSGVLRLVPIPRLLNGEGKRFFERIYSSSNPSLFRDHFRMDKELYDILFEACDRFISRRIKYRREVIAVTLDWLGRAATCRDQEAKFEMAFSTVHRYRRAGLYTVLRGLAGIIDLPSAAPAEFVQKFPYFDQAVVAIGGVHVPVMVSVEDAERFRNRKGWTSTNVLIVSDWQLNVAFIYPGAEGAAHDSMVLAHSNFLQKLPDHVYVLADAGYALHPQILTPYRGVRYHLNEFAEGTGRPQTAKELFNLRHAKARNVVERLNGCMKRRFRILRVPIECEFVVVKAIVFSCASVHNFIRRNNVADFAEDLREDGDSDDDEDVPVREDVLPFDFNTPSNWRDWMASTMWNEYNG